MKLTKHAVKMILGIDTDAALSRHFGLSRGAAFFWRDDEEIPAKHRIQLLQERPDLALEVLGSTVESKAA